MSQALTAKTVDLVDKVAVFEEKSARTPEQIRGYILHSAQTFRPELSAKIESDNPGALQLEFNKEDKYYLTILFTYDHAGFKASYVSSKNLNFADKGGDRIIHENTMIWLDEIIRKAKAAYGMQLSAKGEVINPQAVAELNFRSTGATDTVTFYKTDETHACGKYDMVGRVASWSESEIAAREQEINDWNARLQTMTAAERRSEPKPMPPRALSLRVVALRTLQISASSSVFVVEEVSASFGTQSRRMRHSCGPLAFRFTPQGARKYSFEYAVSYAESSRGTCTQSVFDVTDPDKRIAVAPEAIEICKK
ncbi:MAG: hypothetical protein V4858_19385 [Pseudomonadota bacterium]